MRTAVLATLAIAAASPALSVPVHTAPFARDAPAYASDASGALSLKTLASVVGAGAPIVGAIVDHFSQSSDEAKRELWARGDSKSASAAAAKAIAAVKASEAAKKKVDAAHAAKKIDQKGRESSQKNIREDLWQRELVDVLARSSSGSASAAVAKAIAAAKAAEAAKKQADATHTAAKMSKSGRENSKHNIRRDVWLRDLAEVLARSGSESAQAKAAKAIAAAKAAEAAKQKVDAAHAAQKMEQKGREHSQKNIRDDLWKRELVEVLARSGSESASAAVAKAIAAAKAAEAAKKQADATHAAAKMSKGGRENSKHNIRDLWQRDLVEVLARSLEELD
ncbi:hypothetical protein PsYK624_078950 [Phanerochaete sordida]|uniref:Uncharacterized protein n=1 Tax=Phanerochaete sordida TaxID=48140 RepID=A0A9P3GDD4_9APHY|nr:hypothetical protein PsYK624_078950 [Phanerochaete sordida]